MNQSSKTVIGRTLGWEYLTITLFTAMYLIVFNRTVPHGDALRIVRQIQDNHLIWNPNHLIFDPLGYGWHWLLENFGINISVLNSFEIISGVSTVVSLIIFHAILVQVGIKWWGARFIAVSGLFASRSFLSMANSQYYFMVQMPFLLGVIYLAMRFMSEDADDRNRILYLYGMGILAAIASAIMFNNVLLVMALGLVVGFSHRKGISNSGGWHFNYPAHMWTAAVSVGLPIFLFGYVASGSGDSFFRWLLSYQGESASTLNDLYGIQWTVKGVAEGLARLGFNYFSASVIENAGLGTWMKALLFREPLEFVPESFKLLLAISLTPVIVGMQLLILIWAVRRLRRDPMIQFMFAWIGAFLVFNFLWDVGGDMFWFQIMPITWLMLMAYLGYGSRNLTGNVVSPNQIWWKLWVVVTTVSALFVVNTLQTVVPVSLVDLDARNAEYHALLRDGDLEVVPGWDGLGWMQLTPQRPRAERLTLMNMALQSKTDEKHIQRLPSIVADYLKRGQRVVVVRLYDKDYGINPWSGLARLGWPRPKIQALLSNYCNVEIGKVGDVVFREITTCQRKG